MASSKIPTTLTLALFCTFIIAELFLQGFAAQVIIPQHQDISHSSPSQSESHLQAVNVEWRNRNSRRILIGSTAPTCTYNECRGCRFKCRAEQIPVDANDPINSAYHYKCVCHR